MGPSIAVDAMGGDHAPREVVRGTVLAARELPDARFLLVGEPQMVERELGTLGWSGEAIEIVPASEVIGMGEVPTEALRRKRDASIPVGLRLVGEKRAAAFVGAGNTGACVAAAQLLLRTLPEVKRAGIAVAFYMGAKPVTILDVGANVEARPEHLLQYGVMATLYAAEVLGVENPRVGLLNIGEEGAKGNRLVKETHELFRTSGLNFYGNVEGVEIFKGVCDVVISDGFTGNIVLKVSEGLGECLMELFRERIEELLGGLAPAGGLLGRAPGGAAQGPERLLVEALASVKSRLDYSEFGGAPLLGVNGTVIIAHGRSDAKAIYNAIRVARRMTEVDINSRIVENVRALGRGENVRVAGRKELVTREGNGQD